MPPRPAVSECGASVINYGLGLTTMSQTNLLKLDRVQNEAMRVILGTTKDTPTETMRFTLDLPPMQTRQSGSILQCWRKSPQPTPWSPERHKKAAHWGEASHGWVKQRRQYCRYASWQNWSKTRNGKVPKPIPAPLWDTPGRKLWKPLSRVASKQSGFWGQAAHARQQQAAGSHSLHWWLSDKRPVRVEGVTTIHEDNATYEVSTSSLTMEIGK